MGHPVMNRPWRTWAAFGLFYGAITLVMTQPLVNLAALATASYPGDARLIIWTLAWDNHAVLARLPLFAANIFFPSASSLDYAEHHFGISLFTLPIYAITRNPTLGYNLIWLSAWVLNALAMHGLVPLMLSEWFVVHNPVGRPQPMILPAIFTHPSLRTARAYVALPDHGRTPQWAAETDYLLFSTATWTPIVNGYGRSTPPEHPHVISHMSAFPGPNNAKTMRELGVEYVVLRSGAYPDGAAVMLADAAASPDYELITRIGTDYLFRVKAP